MLITFVCILVFWNGIWCSDYCLQSNFNVQTVPSSPGNISTLDTLNITGYKSINNNSSDINSSNNMLQKDTFDFALTIPFVKRDNNTFYLGETIRTLLENMVEVKQYKALILMYCGEIDDVNWCSNVKNQIHDIINESQFDGIKSTENVKLSFFIADKRNYPSFDNLPRKYDDSKQRTLWRSKQNVDYSEMLRILHKISVINIAVIQWEDDFIATRDLNEYLKKLDSIINSVMSEKKFWFLLPFNIGGHDIIYNPKEIDKISRFYRLFYWEQPVDWLHTHLFNMRPIPKSPSGQTQDYWRSYFEKYFEHIGGTSSLSGKKWNGLKIVHNPR